LRRNWTGGLSFIGGKWQDARALSPGYAFEIEMLCTVAKDD